MAYDIFISYRRKDSAGLTSGTNIARTIKQQLGIEGYKNRVFFDYSELRAMTNDMTASSISTTLTMRSMWR